MDKLYCLMSLYESLDICGLKYQSSALINVRF